MGVTASMLDRRVQFQRVIATPDGYGGRTLAWHDHGEEIAALRADVKDSEAIEAGAWRSRLMTRFMVRSTEFTRSITTADRVSCEGQTFEIVGIKEAVTGQRRQLLELTAETA